MRDAMRARDERRTQTLRMAMSAAHNRQIELGRALTDEDYVDVLGKQLKQRRESIEAFRAGGREAMAANEEAEAVDPGRVPPRADDRGRAGDRGACRDRRDRGRLTRRPGQGDGSRGARRRRAAPTARPSPTWCGACWPADRCSFHAPWRAPPGPAPGAWARAVIVGGFVAVALFTILSVDIARGQVTLSVGDVATADITAPQRPELHQRLPVGGRQAGGRRRRRAGLRADRAARRHQGSAARRLRHRHQRRSRRADPARQRHDPAGRGCRAPLAGGADLHRRADRAAHERDDHRLGEHRRRGAHRARGHAVDRGARRHAGRRAPAGAHQHHQRPGSAAARDGRRPGRGAGGAERAAVTLPDRRRAAGGARRESRR